MSVPFLDHERALYLVMPHTTALRGTRFEVSADVRRLGALTDEQMLQVEAALRRVFGLK